MDVFSKGYGARMAAAIGATEQSFLKWDDAWWADGLPRVVGPVVFHGSLGNAAAIAARCPEWKPGAYCDVEAFRCYSWYPKTSPWRLQRRYEILPASVLVADPRAVLERLDVNSVFVRPDSPLKPFAGRVLSGDDISLRSLDYGFYFDDVNTPVVVAATQEVGREWRFIVADRVVVAGSAYVASGRTVDVAPLEASVWDFAAEVAAAMPPPEPVYVLDVCETEDGYRLLELDPFSGADLYGCDLNAVVAAVAAVVARELRHND